MTTPRFYCPGPLQAGTEIVLPDEVAHHALRVLRLRDGAGIVLFDGEGGETPATVHADGKRGLARLGRHDPREAELPGPITLAQGLPAGDKMEWVIEKAVEMGVTRIAPIAARRSVLQLDGPRLEKRLARWQALARSASEQCGRNRVARVDAPVTLPQWLAAQAGTTAFLCHPDAQQDLAQALPPPDAARQGFAFLVGPEGGWDDEELQAAARAGTQAIRFGPRVLRTETAGIALVAAATALLGWQG
ncbi:16S rRNA (uracil(1498)-N(3))-methyltransferase [Orrella dioscoreae]|uniref:Ribosomal RNA small subunit methyltransferase E n=2 Tax=root TaxID=1 RepID=A0A1C3K3V7_9BURK|nr:16S rRNA (uracil(1498)-N(3))-methyltransferase [Orrella dioscoreae]SBT26193.1 Ribosomal RNA small subunit methyltransferase E [Orrella dioscoreae]SOE51263.1 Ribosomal RNA small subunit methyltransferase E [Orrella dioscoreae]